jgi:hypothetical protein
MSKLIRDPVVASDERTVAESQWAAHREPRTPGGQHYPTGVPGVPAALTGEESALRRLNPRRSRWPELDAFNEKVHEMEVRIVELGERSRAVHERLLTADREDAERYAAWLLNPDGDQPEPEKPQLEEERDRAVRELAGAEAALGSLLEEKARLVAKHRPRLVRDGESATAEARARYEQAVADAEEARRELVELRETTIWAELYPDCHESDVQLPRTIAGGERKRLAVTLGMALDADKLFDALRQDAEWIERAIPHNQLARDRLTAEKRTPAIWDQSPEGQEWKRAERHRALERLRKPQ